MGGYLWWGEPVRADLRPRRSLRTRTWSTPPCEGPPEPSQLRASRPSTDPPNLAEGTGSRGDLAKLDSFATVVVPETDTTRIDLRSVEGRDVNWRESSPGSVPIGASQRLPLEILSASLYLTRCKSISAGPCFAGSPAEYKSCSSIPSTPTGRGGKRRIGRNPSAYLLEWICDGPTSIRASLGGRPSSSSSRRWRYAAWDSLRGSPAL